MDRDERYGDKREMSREENGDKVLPLSFKLFTEIVSFSILKYAVRAFPLFSQLFIQTLASYVSFSDHLRK